MKFTNISTSLTDALVQYTVINNKIFKAVKCPAVILECDYVKTSALLPTPTTCCDRCKQSVLAGDDHRHQCIHQLD